MEKTIPSYCSCTNQPKNGLEQFQNIECKCKLGQCFLNRNLSFNKKDNNEEAHWTKHKKEAHWTEHKEEDEAHKSKVAKITFKTATAHLLATNPAARRTLGTSKKAQAKFIPPMIGANE